MDLIFTLGLLLLLVGGITLMCIDETKYHWVTLASIAALWVGTAVTIYALVRSAT